MQITPMVRMEGVTGIQSLDELSRAGASQEVKGKNSFQNILQDAIREADDSIKATEIMDEQLASDSGGAVCRGSRVYDSAGQQGSECIQPDYGYADLKNDNRKSVVVATWGLKIK